MANYCVPQKDGDGDDVHLEQGLVQFTENGFYTTSSAVNIPLTDGSFDLSLQRTPFLCSNPNDGLLCDNFFGPQVQSLDIEIQRSSWDLGLQGGHDGQAQAIFTPADIVSQVPFESPSALDQIIREPLPPWGKGGETTLFTSSFLFDPSEAYGLSSPVDARGPLLPLAEFSPAGLNNDLCYNCFDDSGWCADTIKPPPPIAPKPSAIPSSREIPYKTHSSTPKRKRSQFDEEGKSKVKKVRKVGACFRCKIYKLPCNEELPCMNCIKVKDKQKVFFGPCIRPNIFDVQSFRAGDGDNGQLRSILPEYKWLPGGKTMMVKLQWPFRRGHVDEPMLEVACQMFTPKRGQNTVEEFSVNNVVRRVPLPPWACRDTESAQKGIARFLGECQGLLEDEIRVTLKDPILQRTWVEAIRYRAAHKSTLVTRALQVFGGAMMNSKYPMSVIQNVFGVPDELDTPYFFEKLPLPAQLTYQIQTMIAHEMLETQTLLLKELKNRIFHRDRQRHWYEVYLTVFILLATIEFVYRVQMWFVRAKAGVSARNLTNIAFVTQTMLEEWEASAHNLINHFRCVMNGELPFRQSWEDGSDNPRRTGLDARAVEYIRAIKHETETRMDELAALRELEGRTRFERPLGAICELFLSCEA